MTFYFCGHQSQDAVHTRLEEIGIREFDLSLSSMRLINQDRISGIEQSMKVHGQLQPVIARVYEGGIQLIDGFKRLYSAENLLIDSLECRLFEVDERQARIMLLSYNRTNQRMEVWEEAMILKDLLERYNLDQRQLAMQTGHSPTWVSRRLSLIGKLDQEVASEIRMGTLTSRHARALIRLPRGNQIAVARVISEYHLSSRLSDRLITAYLEAKDADKQRQILAQPEHIIWYQRYLPEDPYDSRLSGYGNELMHSVINLHHQLNKVLPILGEGCLDELAQSEMAIIYPFLTVVLSQADTLSEAGKRLQIT